MPTLLLLRHGKSDWEAAYQADVERPLATRGRRAAATIGRHLADVGPRPDLALSSPAVRARETLDRVLAAAGIECAIRVVDALYDHGTAAALDELRAVDGSMSVVLMVGHEPTSSDLISTLTGAEVRFPTAALARIDSDVDWQHLGPGDAALTWLVLPRELEADEHR